MPKLKLEVGSFGEDVKNLHRKLAKQGFAIPSSEVDRAFFGPGTRDAVFQWQRGHGLPGTGIVDERRRARSGASIRFHPTTRLGPIAPPRTAVRDGPSNGIFTREISEAFAQARDAAGQATTRKVIVNGTTVPVPYPFPSPTDWRDCWMIFLIITGLRISGAAQGSVEPAINTDMEVRLRHTRSTGLLARLRSESPLALTSPEKLPTRLAIHLHGI